MTRTELRQALENYLESSTSSWPIEIAWPESSYTPSADQAYIMPNLKITDTDTNEIGRISSAADIESGFFFIRVLSPVSNGLIESELLSEDIRNIFRRKAKSVTNDVSIGKVTVGNTDIDSDDDRFYYCLVTIEIPFNIICD